MYVYIKRLLDVTLALLGLIVLCPLMLITAIAIKLDSEGPVIFRQQRLGLKGRPFVMYKFRSMCVNAEKQGVYEVKGDSRVTRVGRIIRKTSIDELPQFLNIIKGDMSIVGPRPTLTYHPWPFEDYSKEQKKRFDVRPGVTGWAQVNGRKDISWEQRIEYDIEYVDNLSFWFDVKVFLKTVIQVIAMQDNINTRKTA